jgi:hypothetical protein
LRTNPATSYTTVVLLSRESVLVLRLNIETRAEREREHPKYTQALYVLLQLLTTTITQHPTRSSVLTQAHLHHRHHHHHHHLLLFLLFLLLLLLLLLSLFTLCISSLLTHTLSLISRVRVCVVSLAIWQCVLLVAPANRSTNNSLMFV